MNPSIQLKQTTSLFFVAFGLVCFGLSTAVQAVTPAPDGGYPGGNTAEGQNALLSLTTGGYNTAVGFLSLRSNTDGSFNTAVGAGTLPFNIGDQSTGDGIQNTAIGTAALLSNTIGASNTATGVGALLSNTTGNFNTANGEVALVSNTTGAANTASGIQALHNNTTGSDNTALGTAALYDSTTGSDNIAVGAFAGMNVTTAHNTICIGAFGNNVDDSCYIASIFNATSSGGTPVFINLNGRLGTMTSSRRFKEEIKPMESASEALFALKPVTFRYKKEIDPAGSSQLGLVAEEVDKVNPDLVVRDKEGKPYSVRYEQVNAMLLNEFLKEHRKVEHMQKQINALTAGLQKVSAQLATASPSRGGLELSQSASQTVLNSP